MPLFFFISFNDFSAWWLILCLAVGIIYAVLLYKFPTLASKPFKLLLFTLRFLVISSLCILLLNPLFINVTKKLEKQAVIIAQNVQTTANHQLLYILAAHSGGEMISPKQINTLPELLKKSDLVKTLVHEDVTFESLINLKYLFFLLLHLISAEWFLRKRNEMV
jgi:hypothetical protein